MNDTPKTVSGRVVKKRTSLPGWPLIGKGNLRALGAANPVALHQLDRLGPVDPVEVVQQPVGVSGDLEEPLLEVFL